MRSYEQATLEEGLEKIAKKVWKNMILEYLNLLYESMLWRMQDVVDAERGHTKH